jgi:hypothetical protein
MYATIEPRLIALLNDGPPSEPFVPYPRLDLPPLDNNILKSSGRPSPLEPNANSRSVKRSALSTHQNVPCDRDTGESSTGRVLEGKGASQTSSITGRALGGTSPQSLRKILEDVPDAPQSQSSKRRQRTDNSKDEYFQLPQPVKKQKAKQVVPPIIIGLFEPPPNQAALFPPIASSSFHDSHGRNSLNMGPPKGPKTQIPPEVPSKNINKLNDKVNPGLKYVTKTRKKWTEEETAQLLLGVQAHGVGNWTKILHDPQYKFDGRKAVDLKDRFRTCCPTELRGKGNHVSKAPEKVHDGGSTVTPKLKPDAENTLIDSDGSSTDEKSAPTPRKCLQKSRAHRKNLEDLAELGIKEPFKKSGRRERRPFSEEEDRAILQGFQEYGTAWARILKDPRFNLKGRRPTDLRDRLRNKYPEKYNPEEEAEHGVKEAANSANQTGHVSSSSQILPASSIPLEPPMAPKVSAQLSASSVAFKDNFLELLEPPPLADVPDTLSFDWSFNMAPFPNAMGEMDLSRILLDDTWNPRKFG